MKKFLANRYVLSVLTAVYGGFTGLVGALTLQEIKTMNAGIPVYKANGERRYPEVAAPIFAGLATVSTMTTLVCAAGAGIAFKRRSRSRVK